MIKVRIATEIIMIGLWFLKLAKRFYPKVFATFRVMLEEQLKDAK